ncbi:MAG TPA: CPBP family intramembrane glutamic endopeptidase, partial [Bacteroidota bacterium]
FTSHFEVGRLAQGSDLAAALYLMSSAFLLMAVIPLLLVRFVFRERLRDYGVCLGDWRKGMLLTLIVAPLATALLLFPASRIEDIRSYYPLAKSIQLNYQRLVVFELLRGILFYWSWEFFFRGFMLRGLKSTFGAWEAILVQTIPSCLWHIGTPAGEIFGSIIAGVFFGWLALRTRSILYGFILHWSFGIALDVFIIYF